MLAACVAPPLPNHELPHQVSIQPSPGQRVFEIVTPPGGLLVRRLAADLAGLGHEVAWVRPPPFEPDLSSLASLLLMALAAARRPLSAGQQPIVVMESPTSAQAELIGGLLTPYAPGAFTPSVVLIIDVQLRTCVISADAMLLEPPSWSAHQARGLLPGHADRAISLRQLCLAANGLAGLIESALRAIPQLGGAEFAQIVAEARQPAALTGALAGRLLSSASADRLAALEMAGHLGYAHARFRSLEPAMAGQAEDPWWVPLSDGWLQMDPAWRTPLVARATQAASVTRSACLSRLVAELADEGAVHEAIEISINAGWHGLAADLLTGEAERILLSGRCAALMRWLDRLPAAETRGHPALATLARELQPAPRPEDVTGTAQRSLNAPVSAFPPRRHWTFRRSSHRPADPVQPSLTGPVVRASSLREEGGTSAHAPTRPGRAAWTPGTPAIAIGERPSAAPGAGHRDTANTIRVDARLLGPFEFHIDGRPVQQWHGHRGRMLLAYLLLHRSRPLSRDALGGVFWPDAAPDIARNRLHVALYGLRRDLRTLSEHPIVVHGQAGFSFNPDVDLWLDTETFNDAVDTARREEAGRTEAALTGYETALELYQGDLLEDAPFEEWPLLDREQLRVKHLETLDRTATMHFELGHYAECIQLSQRLASGDLCREDIHRQLMRCYARLNQPHLAAHQYHQCERQLRDELGLKPADPTRQLYEQIRRRQLV